MRFTLFLMLLLSLANLAAQNDEDVYSFEFSARGIVLFNIFPSIDLTPAFGFSRADASDIFVGSAYQLGVQRQLGRRFSLGVGVDAQFIGMKTGNVVLTDENAQPIGEGYTADRILALGLPISLKYRVGGRAYLRSTVSPQRMIYRKSIVKDQTNDRKDEYDLNDVGVEFRDFNLGLHLGFGYYVFRGTRSSVFLETAAEYQVLDLFPTDGFYNRRQIGWSLKIGLEI